MDLEEAAEEAIADSAAVAEEALVEVASVAEAVLVAASVVAVAAASAVEEDVVVARWSLTRQNSLNASANFKTRPRATSSTK